MSTRALILVAVAAAACLGARAQTITGAATDELGMRLWLYISGMGTNGTASMGWGTNWQPCLQAPRIRMQSSKPGFLGGQPVYHYMETYGGARMRFPWPGDGFIEALPTDAGVRVAFSLTDHVFAPDTNLTVSVDAGLYTQGGTNSAAVTDLPVTNLSTQVYPLAIAAWTGGPGWQPITSSVMRVEAKGNAGQRPWPPRPETFRRPLAAMAFVASDGYGNSVTQWVDRPTIDPDTLRPLPSARYHAELDLSTFTNRSQVRVDYVAFPHLGTQEAVLSTLSNRWTGVTGLPCAITNLYDPLGEYSVSVALVATNGSDSLGTTTTWAAYQSHTNPFATTARALYAIRTNNAASTVWAHDDIGGGTVIVRQGDAYAWLGGSYSYGSAPAARAVVQAYPGETVWYTTQSGNTDAGDRLEVRGLNFGGSASMFNGTDYLTMRSCVISNSHSLAFWQNTPVLWLIDCKIPKVTGGLRPYSTHNTRFHLDGCDLTGFSGSLAPALMAATVHPQREGAASFVLSQDTSSGGNAPTEFFYWADSYISGLQQPGSLAWWVGQNISITNGGVIENSAFFVTTNSGSSVFNLGGSVLPHWNIVIDSCEFGGARFAGYGYNQSGTNSVTRRFILHRNSITQNLGYKTDTFTGDGGADANRTGNWPLMWGLGHRGNVHYSCDVNGGSGPNFPPEFYGLVSHHPMGAYTNSVQWPRWVDPRSQGDANLEGVGSFRLRSDSPIWDQFACPRDVSLPYDLDGVPRGDLDPPGPYVSGSIRRTAAFLIAP